MFLDDELLQITENADLSTPERISAMYKQLIERCVLYQREKLNDEMSPAEIKSTIDRSFNLWDAFVRKLKNDPDQNKQKLVGFLETHSYKKWMFEDPVLSDLYHKLTTKQPTTHNS